MSKQAWWQVVSIGALRLGGRDDDLLTGTARNDLLIGRGGNDVLVGAGGKDLLLGGRGSDAFVYNAASDSTASSTDTIVDFQRGEDVIDLRPLLGGYNPTTGVDTVQLAWGGTTPTANGVWYTQDVHHHVTYVRADVNGSPASSELVIRVLGLHHFTADDFLGVGGAVNTPPDAQADKTITVAEDSGSTPLAIAAPTDAEGGALRITVSAVPAGVGTVYLADGVTAVAAGQDLTVAELQGLVFKTTNNASGTSAFSYTVTDSSGASDSQTVSLVVTGVADTPSLTVASGSGAEDAAIGLSISASLADTPEVLSVEIRGVPPGATLSSGSLSSDGTYYTVAAADLAGLTITPPANFAGEFTLQVTAVSTEGGTRAESLSQDLLVTVSAVADAPTLSVEAASGNEDSAIPLVINAGLVDVSETLSIRISGVPAGATLSAGIDEGGGNYTLTPGQLAGLTITPPHDSDAEITLTVTAISTDTGGVSESTSADLQVTVLGVADAPAAPSVATASGDEDTPIPLSITPPAPADTDGSESIFIHISGLPEGATLSASTPNEDGSYTLSLAELEGLTVTSAPHSDANFTLQVKAIAVDSDGSSAESASADLAVTVAPIADAPILTVEPVTARPFEATPLSISVQPVDPSEDVVVAITGVTPGTTLNHGTLSDGIWRLSLADLEGLTITPGSSFSMALTVTATSSDGPDSFAVSEAALVVTVPVPFRGQAIDGYIVGATVFADANENGVLDAGEASAVTGANGEFLLAGASGPLVLTGGTDISTGLPFEGVLRAPEGSTVVTPLTTLIESLVQTGATAAEAEASVEAAFGLSNFDLTHFDPVQAAQAGDSLALEVYSAGVQVQNTIALASSLLEGAGADAAAAGQAVLSTLAQTIADAGGGAVNLDDSGTAQNLILESANAAGVAGDNINDTAAQAGVVIAAVNDEVDTAGSLSGVAQAAVVAQDDAAAALEEAGATGDADAAEAGFTGAALDGAVADAADEIGPTGPAQFGTPGNDVFIGTAASEAYDGSAGNDRISGNAGNDYLFGNIGDDTLQGDAGADILDGGTTPNNPLELDVVTYSYAGSGVSVNLATGTASVSGDPADHDTVLNFEYVGGSVFADTLTGGNTANNDFERFEGGAGNDTIDGGVGFDEAFYGNAGAGITVDLSLAAGQVISDGHGGSDTLFNIEAIFGTMLADSITGSAGNDRFRGQGGNDVLNGGAGIDESDYRSAGASGAIVNLSPAFVFTINGIATDPLRARDGQGGIDILSSIEQARGGNSNDAFQGDGGDNRFRGEGGNDFFIAAGGNNLIEGGENPLGSPADFDTIHYDLTTAMTGVSVNLATGIALNSFGGTDTLVDIESVNGSRFDDTLIGGNPSNGNWINVIEQFEGRLGNDLIDGGAGVDRASYQSAAAGVTVDLLAGTATGGAGNDTLVNIEHVRGSGFADVLLGANNSVNNIFGQERFDGREGNDTIDGRGGVDMADYTSSNAGVVVNLDTVDHGVVPGIAGSIPPIPGGPNPGEPIPGGPIAAGTARDGFGGVDTLANIEQVRGSNFSDVMFGSANTTLFESFDPQGGTDFVDGGDGIDIIRYSTMNVAMSIDLTLGVVREGIVPGVPGSGFLSDRFFNIEGIQGSTQNDFLYGGVNDAFEVFDGWMGSDFIDGRTGYDRIEYRGSPTGVNVNLATGTASDGWGGTDTLMGIEEISGSYFSDTFTGSAGDESFIGRAGNDSIDGGGGIDTASYFQANSGVTVHLTAGTASDGEGGTDSLVSIERVIGSDFNDVITGTSNSDTLEGGAGNDVLLGSDGEDTLRGGAGDDLLGGGNQMDVHDGGEGIDTWSRANANAGTTMDLFALPGAPGYEELISIENLTGSVFGDTLRGDDGANVLTGLDGNDLIIGRGGDDRLLGGLGSDTLDGGLGADFIDGGKSNQPGSDFGTDFDVSTYAGASAGITASLLLGTAYRTSDPSIADTLVNIEGLIGSAHNDVLSGGNTANDDFERLEGGDGDDTLDGGSGFDEVSYANAPGGAVVDLSAPSASDGYGNVDTLANFEAVVGSMSGDSLTGNNGDNRFRALAGADAINGGAGVDEVDYRQFGVNNTSVQITGVVANLGATTVSFNVAPVGAPPINLTVDPGTARDGTTAAGGALDTLSSIENLRGSDFNDMLVGNGDANWLRGDGGDDWLVGNGGNDRLEGGLTGNDTLVGGAGDDVLNGGDNRLGTTSDFDVLDYFNEGGGGAVTVNLATGAATDSFGDHDTVSGIEIVIGTAQGDTLTGGAADNNNPYTSETFIGRGGVDQITGGVFNNWADYRFAAAGISVDLAAGAASNDGDGASDTLTNINRVRGSNSADQFFGSNNATGDERFEGMGGSDVIDGLGGMDYVEYGFGRPFGSPGVIVNLDSVEHETALGVIVAARSAIDGLGGTDTFSNIEGVGGSNFNDSIWGSDNPLGTVEAFEGRAGNDFIDGGGGFDRVEYIRAFGGVSVNLGTGFASDGNGGNDTLLNIEGVRGSMFIDSLFGNGGDNVLEGWEGNDFMVGHAGDDLLDGGESLPGSFTDFDIVSYFEEFGGPAGAVSVNLALGTATDTFGDTDTLINVEGVRGTSFADTLIGGNTSNDFTVEQFEGRGGNDFINGSTGLDVAQYQNAASAVHVDLAAGSAFNDGDGGVDTLISIEWVRGSQFADRIFGSNNAEGTVERFEGLAGNDFMDGRGGFDQLVFQSSQSGVTVDLLRGWVVDGFQGNVDTFLNMEGVRGSNFADSLFGTDNMSATEVFEGLNGGDAIDGRGGRDRVEFQRSEGAVSVNLGTGVAGDGFGTFDSLVNIEDASGSTFNDTLVGNSGNNRLDGRDGNDVLSGGGGQDTFAFSRAILGTPLPGQDTITDFALGAGGDKLDIRDLLVGFNPAALSQFVAASHNGTDTTVSLDRDGGAGAYGFQALATLSGVTTSLLDDLNLVTS